MTQGERLRALRDRVGMRQEDVAKTLGRGRSSIANMENDKQKLTLAHAVVFARLYGVTLDALAGVDTTLDGALGDYAEGYERGREFGRREVARRVLRAIEAPSE